MPTTMGPSIDVAAIPWMVSSTRHENTLAEDTKLPVANEATKHHKVTSSKFQNDWKLTFPLKLVRLRS